VYLATVKEAIYEFIVTPCNDNTQVLKNLVIENDLEEEIFSYKNIFGFQINRIRTDKTFNSLHFKMSCCVQKLEYDPLDFNLLSLEQEKYLIESKDFLLENHFYLYATDYTKIDTKYHPDILFRNEKQNVLEFGVALNDFIYKNFPYTKSVTTVSSTVNDVLAIKKGVCQDFTHLFIAICRKNKIPARYVSGYLDQGKNFTGSSMMHAWAEILIPGVGWLGFDPTNNLIVNSSYIKVAHGVDYKDCSPIKGVLRTNGDNKTSYEVIVTSDPEIFQNSQQQQQ